MTDTPEPPDSSAPGDSPPPRDPEGRAAAPGDSAKRRGSPSHEQAPLLRCDGASIATGGSRLLELGDLVVPDGGLCLIGETDPVVRLLLQDATLESGRFEIVGQEPHAALRSGRLGLGLSSSRLNEEWTVGESLEGAAALVGADKNRVTFALERTRTTALKKSPLRSLSPLQRRLVTLAHAIVSEPEAVFLAEPFRDLEDSAADYLEVMLHELMGPRWIAAISGTSPWERRLVERASAGVVILRGGRASGPFSAGDWLAGADVFWVRVSSQRTAVSERLEQAGAEVHPSERAGALLVRGVSGASIALAASEAGSVLLELAPLSPGGAPSCY